jgi:hypothetical protein
MLLGILLTQSICVFLVVLTTKLNFHQHSANLSLHQKGIKVFNSLPRSVKKATGNIK